MRLDSRVRLPFLLFHALISVTVLMCTIRTGEISAPFASRKGTSFLDASKDSVRSIGNLIVAGLEVDRCVDDCGAALAGGIEQRRRVFEHCLAVRECVTIFE